MLGFSIAVVLREEEFVPACCTRREVSGFMI